ncbi:MAG: hypothetical protein WD426_21055 [Anditalea sp.]
MLLRTYLLLPAFILFYSIIGFFGLFVELVPITSAEDSLRAEPDLKGPTGVCLSAASGFKYEEYTAGGDPTDVFNWSITDANGFEVYNQANRGLDKIIFAFSVVGTYQVHLRVYRGADQNYYQKSLSVVVQNGPEFSIPPDVVLCGDDAVTIQAVNPDDPNIDQYNFSWLNEDRVEIGTQNTLEITEEGRYFIKIISAACEVEATTYAGPSIEVEVTPSTTVACLRQTVSYTPDTPISALWSYQKAGQSQRIPLGEFFTLNLDTEDLEGTGDYTIFFNAEDERRPGCSVEKSFPLKVNEEASFTLTKISDGEDCDATNGSFKITASTQLDEIYVNGVPDAVFNQLNPSEERTVSGLVPKLYVVTGTLNGCSISKVISIDNENVEDPIQFEASAEDATCSSSGVERGSITLDFEGGPQTGEYTFISSNGEGTSGAFTNKESVTVELPSSTYSIKVKDPNNCTSPEQTTLTISSSSQVAFSVPSSVTACEFYELSPVSDQELDYNLTGPNGSSFTGSSGSTFKLEESGTYSLLATPKDPSSTVCPRTGTFEASINEQITFDISQRIIDCYGNQIFTAELQGKKPSDVVIRWLNEAGNIVGREVEFFPPSTGNFSLDVQPRRSSGCPATPIPFEVTIPSLEVPVEISASSFCGSDPFSTLSVEAEPKDVERIQWFFTDSLDVTTELLDLQDKWEADVTEEGTYEVVVRRLEEPTCELGRATYDLVKSVGIPLVLAEEYHLCSAENIFPTISPGDFESYSWLLEGVEIDTASVFKPSLPGNYELVVSDGNNCEATAAFEVVEKCETMVRFPNALIPGNNEKDFRVYVDPLVEDLEIFIYSRTGELVYHCNSVVEDPAQTYCLWDGLIKGKKAITGTYALIIRYNSEQHPMRQMLKRSLFVVE